MQDLEFMKVIRQTLLENPILSKTLSGVFTTPLVQDPFPYITLNLESMEKGLGTTRLQCFLKVWSAYQGVKEIHELCAAVQACLEKPGISLTLPSGGQVVLKRSQQQMETSLEGFFKVTFRYDVLIQGEHL